MENLVDDLETELLLAYRLEHLQKTQLYRDLRSFQERHGGRLFR